MKELFVIFLIANSLFWGLFPHDVHENFCNNFLNIKCPPHYILLLISFLSFFIAIVIVQKDYFDKIFITTKKVVQTGGRILSASGKLVKSTANNFDNLDEFADSFETFVDAAIE